MAKRTRKSRGDIALDGERGSASAGGGDGLGDDNLPCAPANNSGGEGVGDNESTIAAPGSAASDSRCDDKAGIAAACLLLQELQRQRVTCIRAVNRLGNASGSYVRRAMGWNKDMPEKESTKIKTRAAQIVKAIKEGEADPNDPVVQACGPLVMTFAASTGPLVEMRAGIEKEMIRLAKTLPAAPFIEKVRGVSPLGLAVIVGEAGDLSGYSGPDKLRKRLGVAPKHCYPIHVDERTGKKVHMVPKRRRGEMYGVIIESLFKAQSGNVDDDGVVTREAGPYRLVYDQAKASREGREGWTKMRAHLHALFVMLDKFLVDLWREWRGAKSSVETMSEGPRHSRNGNGGEGSRGDKGIFAAVGEGWGGTTRGDKSRNAPALPLAAE